MLKPFGKIVVTAGGTPVRATSGQDDPDKSVPTQSFIIQALPGNSGVVYVFAGGNNFSGDHRTSLDVCIAIIPAPTSPTAGPFPSASFSVPVAPSALNIADIWIDVSVSGNGALITSLAG